MKLTFLRRRWFQVLAAGVIIFVAAEQALERSHNLGLLPFVIILGAFLVPVTFVIYFYEYVRDRDISTPLLTTCFIVGGLTGVAAAGVVEYRTISGQAFASLAAVGLIEESAKLIFPMVMFVFWKYRHEADGLLFGVASVMGFAALETTGYALVSFVRSHGDVGLLQQVLLFRGLVSPAGHAAWTGFVSATLWRSRQGLGRGSIAAVVGAFAAAVALHTLWDATAGINSQTSLQLAAHSLAASAIIAVGLSLIIWRLRQARALALGGKRSTG